MDLKLIRKLSLSIVIFFTLFLAIILTNLISQATSPLAWAIYSLIIGVTFLTIKLWNRSLPEPLLDVNSNYFELFVSIALAIVISFLGGTLFNLEAIKGATLSIILLALVLSASQFNLLKSIQPDPASPIHGFNKEISISRSVYFCALASLLLACEAASGGEQIRSLVFYKFDIFDKKVIEYVREASLLFILASPIIFVLGLLPQISTLVIHVSEQIDIHLFGSTAITLGLKSALYSMIRSILAISLLYLIGMQKVFSLYCGFLIAIAYFLSRNSSDTTTAQRIFRRALEAIQKNKNPAIELTDLSSAPQIGNVLISRPKLDDILISRLKNDLIRSLCLGIVIFALHITTVFSNYHDYIQKSFGLLAIVWGLIFHILLPQLRRDVPCMCLAKPLLRPREYNLFEVKTHAKLMWFEKLHHYGIAIERNFIYPIFWINTISHDASAIKESYGPQMGLLLLVITSLKLVRSSFNDSSPNFITVIFTYLYFCYDIAQQNYHISTINYFVISILHIKIYELLLKLHFVYSYIAPWQIPWGSAFHAFAQPLSVPHSSLLFFQAILSSILSAPLQPILGSAIFMMSYIRPVRFWERDYNTGIIDNNSTRLVTQLERTRIDSNRLDGIFYEHLTECLQRKLCLDLSLGRWGPVSQGDCFIMASDNLNCLVHIIELGNGVCTFQLRGLEFRGTYCQQQEVEAITEEVTRDDGLCCFEPGHLPHFLSINATFGQLWLAWHVTHTCYVLEGYSISDNPAGPMLQPFDLRRALITYYVKAIIYFTVTSPHLSQWLRTSEFHEALEHTRDKMYADLDPTFSASLDLDFDMKLCGVTRDKFCLVFFDWINYCFDRVKKDKKDPNRAKSIEDLECTPDSFVVSLCYGLSLLARRSLSAASDGQQFHTVDSLLFGLHALLKGDFRITSLHDEWIFREMRFFKLVVIPSVRMALRLHQDHFTAPDDYDDNMALYEAIAGYQRNLVIAHETDVAWRAAVLSGVPSLLTLRLYNDDGSNQYKFIMLNKRHLSFRIIKINRECVRGLWASQQQELIFFRNTDPERGSIQNAKQVLRNMINSSCDLPVGYPIYVSPLTTSYIEYGV